MKIIILLFSIFLVSCTTDKKNKLAGINEKDGINESEASIIAQAYFNQCGYLEKMGLLENDLWAFNAHGGIDGSQIMDSIFVDIKTGNVVNYERKVIKTFTELKEILSRTENTFEEKL